MLLKKEKTVRLKIFSFKEIFQQLSVKYYKNCRETFYTNIASSLLTIIRLIHRQCIPNKIMTIRSMCFMSNKNGKNV